MTRRNKNFLKGSSSVRRPQKVVGVPLHETQRSLADYQSRPKRDARLRRIMRLMVDPSSVERFGHALKDFGAFTQDVQPGIVYFGSSSSSFEGQAYRYLQDERLGSSARGNLTLKVAGYRLKKTSDENVMEARLTLFDRRNDEYPEGFEVVGELHALRLAACMADNDYMRQLLTAKTTPWHSVEIGTLTTDQPLPSQVRNGRDPALRATLPKFAGLAGLDVI